MCLLLLLKGFNTAAVIFPLPLPPSNAAAPLKVTKSLVTAPWLASVTVIVELPLVAAKVISPAAVVTLKGVIS